MAQRGPWWCECELPTIGGPGTCSIIYRAIMPYFIRLLGGSDIEQPGVIQGTAHAHRMPGRRCPPPPVRFPAVLRRSIPAMIRRAISGYTNGATSPSPILKGRIRIPLHVRYPTMNESSLSLPFCNKSPRHLQPRGSLIHYRQRVPSRGADPSGSTGHFDVSKHRAASAPWCIGCAGGSSTKAKFGPPLVQKRRHHKVFRHMNVAWVPGLEFCFLSDSTIFFSFWCCFLLVTVIMAERILDDTIVLIEEINGLLKRLKFSEDESGQVFSINGDKNMQGFESWVVGKIMATETLNREAMYRVFRSLWYTKEEVDFVALKEGVVIVKFVCLEDRSRILNLSPWFFDRCLFSMLPFEQGKGFGLYDFRMTPFWLRVYNLPLEFMDRQMAIDVGNALGELVAIDWKDRFGGWTEFMRIKVRIDILKPLRRVVRIVDKDGGERIGVIKYERLPDFCYFCWLIGHILKRCNNNKGGMELIESNLQYGNWMRAPLVTPIQERGLRRNGVEMVISKFRGIEEHDESLTTSREEGEMNGVKGKEKLAKRSQCLPPHWKEEPIRPMEGCLAVSSEGKSGGLALLWREGVNVAVQSYSKYHIDSVVSMDDGVTLRFTGFYGQTNPSLRQQAWDMLRKVQSRVNEAWIVGGDFNAILNNSKKEGGRRKLKSHLDEFSDFMEELNLTDVKTCNGWSTWTNYRDGTRLVKERLDHFAISEVAMEKIPFLLAYIVRQSKSDHEAILLDTNGSKPKDRGVDHRVWFRYDTCWGKEDEAKKLSIALGPLGGVIRWIRWSGFGTT
ncbi:hypothetical protein GOBAR_AA19008 [Gossypium barbadense]|uniref:DUF4283 domain-containing protein n=1 Tax=Gossypium barbadense TaxID=3634 RepID=A0A2P5XE82_GOSBA|nr:hypothetical protein GOBAR_AA19008 [Gossypium barbadense]